jgi:MFS family permease
MDDDSIPLTAARSTHHVDLQQTSTSDITIIEEDTNKCYSVDQILTLQANGFGRYQWMLFIVTGLAWSFHCMDVFSSQYLVVEFGSQYLLSPLQKSFIGVLTFLGWAIGAQICGTIADRIGRRRLLLVCCGAVVVLCLVTAFAFSYELLLVIRFLTGLSTAGINLLGYGIFSEFVDPKNRGRSNFLFLSLSLILSLSFSSSPTLYIIFALTQDGRSSCGTFSFHSVRCCWRCLVSCRLVWVDGVC